MRARLQLQPVEYEKRATPEGVTRCDRLGGISVQAQSPGALVTDRPDYSIRPATLRLATQYIATMQSEAIH